MLLRAGHARRRAGRRAHPYGRIRQLLKRQVLHGWWLGWRQREEHADRAFRAHHVELAPHPVLRYDGTGVRALADLVLERADVRLSLLGRRVEEEVDGRNPLRLSVIPVLPQVQDMVAGLV